MKDSHRILLEVLKSILNNRFEININEEVNWNEILKLSKEQNITSLVYFGLSKSNLVKSIPNEVLNEFKKQTFHSVAYQLNHINNVSKVLKEFNNNNLKVIALKGLVIRNFYPRPEFRTMGDADICVSGDELALAIDILNNIGYTKVDNTDVDYGFVKGNSRIELHWKLIGKGRIKQNNLFEEDIWNNLMEVQVENVQVSSLGYEDLTVHLIVHLIKHMVLSGCGIRHIYDLAALLQAKGNEINYNSVMNKIREYDLEVGATIIIYICKKYLGVNINYSFDNKKYLDEDNIQELIFDILDNGAFGKNKGGVGEARWLAFSDEKNERIVKKYFRAFFPKCKNILVNYPYANKYKILIPIAYIHRIIKWTLGNKMSLKSKKTIFTKGLKIIEERNKIFQWLDV